MPLLLFCWVKNDHFNRMGILQILYNMKLQAGSSIANYIYERYFISYMFPKVDIGLIIAKNKCSSRHKTI